LDGASRELLGAVEGVAQGVAVVGVAGQRLGVQHELAGRGAAVGGHDRDLDAELVGRARLALADALDLGGMEGIELPAALALLLGADLGGSREGLVEGGLEVVLAADLAADIADQPAEAGAQEAQLAMVAVELLGVGVAAGHQGGALGQPQIGLAKPLAGQAVEALDGGVHQLGVGREGDVLGLHRGVDGEEGASTAVSGNQACGDGTMSRYCARLASL